MLSTKMMPPVGVLVPIYLISRNLGLLDSRTGLVIILCLGNLPIVIWMLFTYFKEIPKDILEAARMDGASEWTIVYRILGPIVKPTLVSLLLVSFVFHYNDYFWPLVMTTDDAVRTLPLGVALLREQGTGVRWHIVMAGNTILSLPVLALFAVVQKQLTRSVTDRSIP